MDLLDKNILLAEFIGMVNTDDGWYDKENILPNHVYATLQGGYYKNLYFQYSYDWLFPVAEKFVKLEIDHDSYAVFQTKAGEAILDFDRQTLFDILVHGIKWYNKFKKYENG